MTYVIIVKEIRIVPKTILIWRGEGLGDYIERKKELEQKYVDKDYIHRMYFGPISSIEATKIISENENGGGRNSPTG